MGFIYTDHELTDHAFGKYMKINVDGVVTQPLTGWYFTESYNLFL